MSVPRVTTWSTQSGPALFEPDVGKQASPTVSLSSTPHHITPAAFFSCAAARPSPATHVGAPTLLWTDRCCTSPPALLLSPAVPLSPSLSPCGIALSIRSPLSLPSLCFHPSLLVWPTAPFRFAQGERVPCVCCLAVCPLSSSPSFSPTSSFPLLSLFPPLIPCFPPLPYPLFLLSATSPPSFSLYLPLSPSLSPPASNHSPSISFTLCLHSYFILRLSLPQIGRASCRERV